MIYWVYPCFILRKEPTGTEAFIRERQSLVFYIRVPADPSCRALEATEIGLKTNERSLLLGWVFGVVRVYISE
jgi:hypothetical protein